MPGTGGQGKSYVRSRSEVAGEGRQGVQLSMKVTMTVLMRLALDRSSAAQPLLLDHWHPDFDGANLGIGGAAIRFTRGRDRLDLRQQVGNLGLL
jgi:hypothetical protein